MLKAEDLRLVEDEQKIVFYARVTHGKPRFPHEIPKFAIVIPKFIVRKYKLRRGMIMKVTLEYTGVIDYECRNKDTCAEANI